MKTMRARLVAAAGLSLWSAVLSGQQAAPAATLPETLLGHLKTERFGIVTSIRGLPLGVREELQTMFGTGLDIAEPGAPFQGSGGGATANLPTRRLILAGCAKDNHCLIYYERGGKSPSWHVMLFHWTPAATRFEWGGIAARGLTRIEDVQKAVLSGAVKGASQGW